ncbi:MAG: hypothetical protein HY606_07620 [Planctomycetes bacterium]|nr:hypothetical protein [Planctomycetota bacterium]
MTKRYQIKALDHDLTDIVHELTTQVVSRVVVASSGQISDLALYPHVFEAGKKVLKKYVRGFHVCGCRMHCDLEAKLTEMAKDDSAERELKGIDFRSRRINRYVLFIDVLLSQFCKELEVAILREVAKHSPVKNWRGLLFPIIKNGVEQVLSKYIYYSLTCNRGEYICQVGTCTEFDPWTKIRPQDKSN